MSKSAVCDFEEKNPPFNSEIIVGRKPSASPRDAILPAKRFFLAVCFTEWIDYFSDPFYVSSKPIGIEKETKDGEDRFASPDNYDNLLETLQKKAPYQNNTSVSEVEEDSRISNETGALGDGSKATPSKKENGSTSRKATKKGPGESTILEELLEESAIEDENSLTKM